MSSDSAARDLRKGRLRRSLRASFIEGAFASVTAGLTASYVIPYGLFLGATTRAVGLLSSLPTFLASLLQLRAARPSPVQGSRRRIVVRCALVQAVTLVPIALLPYLFPRCQVAVLIALISVSTVAGMYLSPAWASMMGDHIPAKKRGTYFGWRAAALGSISLAFSFLAGWILRVFQPDRVRLGFAIIFGLAAATRFASWFFVRHMHDPRVRIQAESHFSFWQFVRRFRESNFVKFVAFVSFMTFATNLAGPFFVVYMIRELEMDYLRYAMLVLAAAVPALAAMRAWGRQADRVGNMRVVRVTAVAIVLLPCLWVLSRNYLYLVSIQVFAGFVWGGYGLCVGNFIYDAASAPKRTQCVAYLNVINGLALCGGAILGGVLARVLPPLRGSPLLSLFVLSGILRGGAALVLIFVREVRAVEPMRIGELFFRVSGLRPLVGIPRAAVKLIFKRFA